MHTTLEFARHALVARRLDLRAVAMRTFGNITCTVLYRSGCWQAELITIPGYTVVPLHRHNRVYSCDVMVGGTVDLVMGGRVTHLVKADELDETRMLQIPRRRWHGGQAGPDGVAFLSFQKWDGVPSFVSDDWEAYAEPG